MNTTRALTFGQNCANSQKQNESFSNLPEFHPPPPPSLVPPLPANYQHPNPPPINYVNTQIIILGLPIIWLQRVIYIYIYIRENFVLNTGNLRIVNFFIFFIDV